MSDAYTDQPTSVRDEDALDAEAIYSWLSTHVDGLAAPPHIQQFGGGASNLTYLLTFGDRELVLRTSPRGTRAASAHDMGREVRVQRALHGHVPVPTIVAHDTEGAMLGREAYVMERLTGMILRKHPPKGLTLTPDAATQLCEAAIHGLADLHTLDAHGVGLGDLGKGQGYVQRQIAGWSRRYRAALTEHAASFEGVMAWLETHQPADVATVIIHNDYRLDNLVLTVDAPHRIIGVLDWEMCTLGDPLMDVGNSLAYWVQEDDPDLMKMVRRQPTHLPGMLTRTQVWQAYAQRTGRQVDNPCFYEVYGLFRLAVIVQQIYLRFEKGQTTNPRFANFGAFAHWLESVCEARIAAG